MTGRNRIAARILRMLAETIENEPENISIGVLVATDEGNKFLVPQGMGVVEIEELMDGPVEVASLSEKAKPN